MGVEMPIAVSWDENDNRILIMTLSGKWTWIEMGEAVEQRNAFLDSIPEDDIVDVIIDLRAAQGLPANTLTGARQASKHRPINEGISVVVGTGSFLQAMFDLYIRVTNQKPDMFYMVKTIDEAYTVIAEKRQERAAN